MSQEKKQPGDRRRETRALNLPGSDVGRRRYLLYGNAYRQIDRALKAGFYIECVAIIESIISDRLEARLACLYPDDKKKHRFNTVGWLAKELQGEVEVPATTKLYGAIEKWSRRRNAAVHQIVKLGTEKSKSAWGSRYRSVEKTVEAGLGLAREISSCVERLNRETRKARSLRSGGG